MKKTNKNHVPILNIERIQDYLDKFIKLRGWEKYRTPKNLCMALSVETSELLKIFQWEKNVSAKIIIKNKKIMEEATEEIADILSYLAQLARILNIDLDCAFWNKIKKTEEKYSIEKTKKQSKNMQQRNKYCSKS